VTLTLVRSFWRGWSRWIRPRAPRRAQVLRFRYPYGMALSKKLTKLILERDENSCWHCGETEAIAIHHRKNRGLGGSKLLDTPDNLMVVCSRWNGAMESSAVVGAQARGWGHKVPAWESLEHPVFSRVAFSWWVLLPDGTKVESEWRDQPF